MAEKPRRYPVVRGGLLPAVKISSQLTKALHFDDNYRTLICWTVQMSALSASAAAAAGESEQRRAPPAPAPPLSQCADSPLGCSVSDYEAHLADASGVLYDCARQGEVDDIRFILDVWSRRQLHLACANGHVGWTYVHKAK